MKVEFYSKLQKLCLYNLQFEKIAILLPLVIAYLPTCCLLEGAPKDLKRKASYIEQYMLDQYDFNEETNAYQLSKVDCDVSQKLNRHLAANCRNISDEVFPGIHLGDRSAISDLQC